MRQLLACVALLALVGGRAYANGEAINGFPNWKERVMHEWTNRARCAPQIEMQACGAACGEGSCYTPKPPIPWSEALNHAARFHSDEMAAQSYFAHDSICTLVSNINSIYPGTCTGAASCACMGGTASCTGACTAWNSRVGLFGANPAGEIIASGNDPNGAFYQWLYESFNQTTCAYVQGPPTNGHRWNILMSGLRSATAPAMALRWETSAAPRPRQRSSVDRTTRAWARASMRGRTGSTPRVPCRP